MTESNHGNQKAGIFRSCLDSSVRAASALLALAAPGITFAQGPTSTSVSSLQELGDTRVEGVIANSDPVANERHYDDYRLRLRAGEGVQIDMESGQFDTYLELWRPGEPRSVASNDDREGGSTNSRVVFSAPAEGDYVVRAQDFFEGRGAYRLNLTRLTTIAAAAAQALPQGATEGIIRAESPVIADPERPGRGLRYQDFAFQGVARGRVSIEMSSGDFDSHLALIGPGGAVVATDDDGGDGVNARIVAILPEAGLYTVRASAPSHRTGSFRLLRHTNQPIPESLRLGDIPEIRAGQTVEGTLDEAAPVRLRQGQRGRIDFFYRLYRLRVTAGQALTLSMNSSDFDPVVESGTLSPELGFAAAERNDDGGSGNNARLVLEPLRTGLVIVRARASGSGLGRFTLRVTAGDTGPAAAAD